MRRSFACFGGRCTLAVAGDAGARSAAESLGRARERLLGWHDRFTRFSLASELSRLNADPRPEVPVSPDLGALLDAIVAAARRTGGLVDGTLAREVALAGYRRDLGPPLPLALALRLAPPRRPARPRPHGGWRDVARVGTGVRRPPGVAFDGGGLAKGLCADMLAVDLGDHDRFVVDCAGDVRIGGAEGAPRRIEVADPFARGEPLHAFFLAAGAVATSGISRRSWLGADGRPAHHLLDPATGRPAFTGVVQATALAPTALEAEVLAKAAVLGGPEAAPGRLVHGWVVVAEDGSHLVVEPAGLPAAA
jgi:thiamine biosynthesis lipoprotein